MLRPLISLSILCLLPMFTSLGCEALTEDADAKLGGGCFAQFSVGKAAQSGAGALGQPCDTKSSPTNCKDGIFVTFKDSGLCLCASGCPANVEPGQACGSGYVCSRVLPSAGGEALICASPDWNLCRDDSDVARNDGGGGPDGNNGGGGTDGTDGTGGSCSPDGVSCTEDVECCSGSCFLSGCG